jgi:hypothetical protein
MAMSESRPKSTRSKVIFIFLLFGLAAVPTGLASPNACDSFCVAKRLLTIFYPQFMGKDAEVILSAKSSFEADGSLSVFQTSISLPIPRKQGVAIADRVKTVDHVTSLFTISADPDEILQMQSFGMDINDVRIKKLGELVSSHPGWSDSQVISAIESSGAKYPPSHKEAVMSVLPLKALEPSIGEVHIDSVTFDLRSDGHPPTPLLDWSVRFTAIKSGKSSHYFLLLEPFNGHVLAFSKVPEPSNK